MATPDTEWTNIIVQNGTSVGPVTDYAETFGQLFRGSSRGIRIDVERESEDGTCTLDVAVKWVNQASGDANDLLDQAGNAVVLNNYANGETGKRFIAIHPYDLGGDADGVLAVGNNTYYRLSLPEELQLVVTHGGTAITNVYNMTVTWLP